MREGGGAYEGSDTQPHVPAPLVKPSIGKQTANHPPPTPKKKAPLAHPTPPPLGRGY